PPLHGRRDRGHRQSLDPGRGGRRRRRRRRFRTDLRAPGAPRPDGHRRRRQQRADGAGEGPYSELIRYTPGAGTVSRVTSPCRLRQPPSDRSHGEYATRTVTGPGADTRTTISAPEVRSTVPGGDTRGTASRT